MFARSLTTVGVMNAESLFVQLRHHRGNDSDIYLAHADDGTCVCLYGRTAPTESIQDTDTIVQFPGSKPGVFERLISERLWERPGTYVFICDTGEKVRVTFV